MQNVRHSADFTFGFSASQTQLATFYSGLPLEGSYGVLALQFSFSAWTYGTCTKASESSPCQHSSFAYPGKLKPLPCFARASDYSAYPKFSQQGDVDSVLRTPKPIPIQPPPTLPGTRKAGQPFAPPQKRSIQEQGQTRWMMRLLRFMEGVRKSLMNCRP